MIKKFKNMCVNKTVKIKDLPTVLGDLNEIKVARLLPKCGGMRFYITAFEMVMVVFYVIDSRNSKIIIDRYSHLLNGEIKTIPKTAK